MCRFGLQHRLDKFIIIEELKKMHLAFLYDNIYMKGVLFMEYFLWFYIFLLIILIISQWVMVEKAVQPGIAVIIPLFNFVVFLRVAGYSGWYILLMCIPFVNLFIFISMLARIARAFGKGIGFTIGLIFLPFIFVPILAFSDAEYNINRVYEQYT